MPEQLRNNTNPVSIKVLGRIAGIKDLQIMSKSETSTNNRFQVIVLTSLITIILFGVLGFVLNNSSTVYGQKK